MEKKTDALVESRIRWKVYVRFGGECLETDHRNMTRRWVLSLQIAANLGGNLGTTINLNQQSAGDQLLTDLGKGAIQGTSQYIAKKMRTIKVHLKAGYNLMLYQKKQ